MAVLPSLEASPIWHPYTAVPATGPRALITKGHGAYLYDAEGKAYFDATSSWWCNLHGHSHPALVEALEKQARVLDQILLAPHAHPVVLEFCQALLDQMGAPFSKVFLSDDGSTAVEAGLKMALQYWHRQGQPQRREFLSLELGYHGDTLGAISVGHIDEFHKVFSALLSTRKSTAPYCYRCPLGKTYPACGVACLSEAERHLEEAGDRIAALVVEPLVLGAGGLVTYPAEYLDRLMDLCRQKGVLVIFDEVFTGFGRTGTFFAYEQLRNRPDIVCLSKGLTSGMLPMGATVATQAIFEAFCGGEKVKFFHGHTFTGNGLSAAVALASLRLLQSERVLERNQELSQFMAGQAERFRALPLVGDVRHLGMIWTLELVRDKATRALFEPANSAGWRIAKRAWEKGVWLRPMGQALYVIPPYCSSLEDLQRCFDVLYAEVEGEG
ncbi:adenosylmethionine--8-amino-7-oxononanoate transaminase [bacterium]|nr:adenosylmethionine--8-amino-7-oxononanoate transaminase [bacterium]